MVQSSSLSKELPFNPPTLKYLSVNSANPKNYFNFLMDKGQINSTSEVAEGFLGGGSGLDAEAKKLINYFFLGITLPAKAFWVNLQPNQENKMTSEELSKTDIGKVLLEQDLQLKRDVSAYLNPKNAIGKQYWTKLYEAIGKNNLRKTVISASNRVWIVPDEAVIMETEDGALIAKATLKVMLESEYTQMGTDSKAQISADNNLRSSVSSNQCQSVDIKSISEKLMKEIVIPAITKDVNESKEYAPLRQVYHSLMLAEWFKQKQRTAYSVERRETDKDKKLNAERSTLNAKNPYIQAINKGWTEGLESQEAWSKDAFFQQYLKSYQQGEYNFIDRTIFNLKRQYFSGGIVFFGKTAGKAYSSPLKIIESTTAASSAFAAEGVKQLSQSMGVVKLSNSATNNEGNVFSDTKIELVSIPAVEKIVEPRSTAEAEKSPASSPNKGNVDLILIPESAMKSVSSPLERISSSQQGIGRQAQQVGPEIEEWINRIQKRFGGVMAKAAGQPVSSAPSQVVKESLQASEYVDSNQQFRGIDLEHFIVAQNNLAERNLPQKILKQVLEKLGLKSTLNTEADYQAVYDKLSDGNCTKEIIDLINSDEHGNITYSNPRLDIAINSQNKNAKAQSVCEAVANSLDALGLSIGQIGKGVKQILGWLKPTGEDRIDAWTKKENSSAYQLTILQDRRGQNYIQIKKVTVKEFQDALGSTVESGTVVQASTKNVIPATDKESISTQGDSQKSITEGIRKRFPYVAEVGITTQIEGQEPEPVNGFGAKEVIVPAGEAVSKPVVSAGKNILVIFASHNIGIFDNGIGMDAQILSRMFVPMEGSKSPKILSGEAAKKELEKVKVVRDKTLPHRISFSRNKEVIMAVDIPEGIQEEATVSGGLMLEFGGLLDVPDSKDMVIMPSDLKPGEKTNFQLAIEYIVSKIISHPGLSSEEKVKYINTIVVGLDALANKGNPNYKYIVRGLRADIQRPLGEIIKDLRSNGFVILPHENQFGKIKIPQDKKAIFLQEGLFDWQGAISLKEFGGRLIAGVTLDGASRLPLVVVPFKPEAVQHLKEFDPSWHTLKEEDRLPIIKTDRFVAIPMELGLRLSELASKRARGLNTEEEKEFAALLQLVNTMTAAEVVTSYEVSKPRENLVVASRAELEKSTGKIDSDAVNNFLVNMPQQGAVPQAVPDDANQKYVLLENGDLVEVGNMDPLFKNCKALKALGNDIYYVKREQTEMIVKGDFFKPGGVSAKNALMLTAIVADGDRLDFSSDNRFVFVREKNGEIDSSFLDLKDGMQYWFSHESGKPPFSIPPPPATDRFSNLQFSHDGKYLVYIRKFKESGEEKSQLVIVRIAQGEQELSFNVVKVETEESFMSDREFNINSFADVLFARDEITAGYMDLYDMETGRKISTVGGTLIKHLHTDSSGSYTVLIGETGKMAVYFHNSKKLLSDVDGKRITGIATLYGENNSKSIRVYVEAKPFSDSVGIIDTGDIVVVREDDEASYVLAEHFTQNSVIFEDIANEKDISNMNFSDMDALQRQGKKGIYYRPQDGLIFVNPKTGDAVYLDPQKPDEPVFTNAKSDKNTAVIRELLDEVVQTVESLSLQGQDKLNIVAPLIKAYIKLGDIDKAKELLLSDEISKFMQSPFEINNDLSFISLAISYFRLGYTDKAKELLEAAELFQPPR